MKVQNHPGAYGVLAGLIVLLIGMLGANAGCAHAQSSGAAESVVRDAQNVAVGKMLGLDGSFKCTVWKVSDDFVMTAGHCCEPGEPYFIGGRFGIPGDFYVTVVDDDEHDVCVLAGAMTGNAIKIVEHDPEMGSPVWTLGYPRGTFLISDGYWSERTENDGIVSSVVGFGSSGSPVLNSRNEAVGLISRRYGDMDNLTLLSTHEWMRKALEDAQALRKPFMILPVGAR